jgi:hypothetical protein
MAIADREILEVGKIESFCLRRHDSRAEEQKEEGEFACAIEGKRKGGSLQVGCLLMIN